MIPTQPTADEDKLRALRAERLDAAVRRIQQHAVESGASQITLEEIDAEIAAVRKERREREAGGH